MFGKKEKERYREDSFRSVHINLYKYIHEYSLIKCMNKKQAHDKTYIKFIQKKKIILLMNPQCTNVIILIYDVRIINIKFAGMRIHN